MYGLAPPPPDFINLKSIKHRVITAARVDCVIPHRKTYFPSEHHIREWTSLN